MRCFGCSVKGDNLPESLAVRCIGGSTAVPALGSEPHRMRSFHRCVADSLAMASVSLFPFPEKIERAKGALVSAAAALRDYRVKPLLGEPERVRRLADHVMQTTRP